MLRHSCGAPHVTGQRACAGVRIVRADVWADGAVRGDIPAFARRARGVLGRGRSLDRLGRAVPAGARRLAQAVLPLVLRSAAEHLLQRARPARRAWACRPAGADLRLSARRQGLDAHVPRPARRRRAFRRRACRTGCRAGRPRHRLHADGAGGRDRDARLRAPRRDPFRRLRRVRGERARDADRGREAEGDRHGLVRDRAGADRRVQAAARRGDRDGGSEAAAVPRPPAPDGRGRPRSAPGRRLEGCSGSGGAGGVRLGRRNRPAVHPLHVRARPGSRRGSSATTAATRWRSRGR